MACAKKVKAGLGSRRVIRKELPFVYVRHLAVFLRYLNETRTDSDTSRDLSVDLCLPRPCSYWASTMLSTMQKLVNSPQRQYRYVSSSTQLAMSCGDATSTHICCQVPD